MTRKKHTRSNVTRRDFIKGAAAGAGGVAAAGSGLLREPSAEAQVTGCEYPFEVPPPPVPASEIKDTFSSDLVIIGAGASGICAALSAAQAGAKVIVIEKGNTFMAHGHHNAAVGSRLQKKLGLHIDRDEVVATLMREMGNMPDQRLIRMWADNSGKAMDWVLDMCDAAGIPVTVDANLKGLDPKYWPVGILDGPNEYFKQYPSAHIFISWNEGFMKMMANNAVKAGVDIRYKTPAVQLVREGGKTGRVTGVIAKTDAGYHRFNGKAVVLCTGDYGHDVKMIQKYCPWVQDVTGVNMYNPPLNTGDGQKMGLWIGAAIDEIPHCSMIFGQDQKAPLHAVPFLQVDIFGDRFMNEDQPIPQLGAAWLRQPTHEVWQVFDDKWADEAPKMGPGFGRVAEVTPQIRSQMKYAIDKNTVLTAGTLDELIQKMNVPAQTLKATVARYNELARGGRDLDFGKRADRMSTIEKAPFYAVKRSAQFFVTLGGLKVNPKLQVLDTQRKVIPGLWAAGNVSGGFFGGQYYPMLVYGLSHGRAITFGRIVGLNAAEAVKAGA
jgi:fumarate reductase flavoprotein subunit